MDGGPAPLVAVTACVDVTGCVMVEVSVVMLVTGGIEVVVEVCVDVV